MYLDFLKTISLSPPFYVLSFFFCEVNQHILRIFIAVYVACCDVSFFVVAHNSTVDVPCNIFLIEKSIFPFVVVSSLSFFYARRSISITDLIAPSAAPSRPHYLINSHQRYVPSLLKQDFAMHCNVFYFVGGGGPVCF